MSCLRNLHIDECFGDIKDPRIERAKKHSLIDIITIGLCSIIAGGEGFSDMVLFAESKIKWLRSFLELKNGIPSHDTFRRVFGLINPQEFSRSFLKWSRSVAEKIEQQHIAIDGKALRASARVRQDLGPIHLVSAWCADNEGLILGQVQTDKKSNEITAIPKLLDILFLQGAIVSIDAMGCQKNIAKKIVERDADYVLALKGNQKKTHKEVIEYFKTKVEEDREWHNYFDYYENTQGRSVRRQIWVINNASSNLPMTQKWPSLEAVIIVRAVRSSYHGGPLSCDYRYYLSSIQNLHAKKADRLVKNHWSIENHLHWSLDVVFSEDGVRVCNRVAAENLGLLRRVAVSLLKKETTKKISMRQKRLRCGFDNSYLKRVYLGLFRK